MVKRTLDVEQDRWSAVISDELGKQSTLNLTEEGARILDALGEHWVLRALDTLVTITTQVPLGVAFVQDASEPMAIPGSDWDPSLTLADQIVGVLSVNLTDSECERIWFEVRVPSMGVLGGDAPYTFFRDDSLAKKIFGRVYRKVSDRMPLALDVWKQRRNTTNRCVLKPLWGGLGSMAKGIRDSSRRAAKPTVWIAMHWLDAGGAESWAFDTAKIAADAGYRVVITADVPGTQSKLSDALAITPHVYIPGNTLPWRSRKAFFEFLLEEFEPQLLHIHHAASVYENLALLRHLRPAMIVIDSTHIREHRNGGFVGTSVRYSNLIDTHHVISPELRYAYVHEAGIDPGKVVYRPLTQPRTPGEGRVRESGPGAPLTIGFLGRLMPQKRPTLFVDLVKALSVAARGQFRFVMQGSGPLGPAVHEYARRRGVEELIDWRSWGTVDSFYADIDLLVITSDNEGLTLTSLEAERAGVLVVSADVGSQRTVVAKGALLPREPLAFLRRATLLLKQLASNPERRKELLVEQGNLSRRLLEVESASAYYQGLLTTMKEDQE